MTQLGEALTEPAEIPVKALFVYNCNAAAVAPDSGRVLQGLRRDDLFTVVHEQFFTDTTDYADIVLPATTFLEAKDLMGAYGHLMAQMSNQAIAPLGEARSNVALFGDLGRRMFPEEPAFRDGTEELIAQALDTEHPWFAGVTKERLEREGHVPLALPDGALPFSSAEWFKTPSGKGELTPVPVWTAPSESRHGAQRSDAFPLEFLPRKADNYMNTTFANLANHQQMERKTAGVLEMHTDDAKQRRLQSGDAVAVWNQRGRIELTVRVGESIAAGVVAARLDWQKLSANGANVNELTSERLTDIGGGATFYSTMVQVRRLDEAASAESLG
jgi:anaerobic selenocysteine-containing dehydrogenase